MKLIDLFRFDIPDRCIYIDAGKLYARCKECTKKKLCDLLCKYEVERNK